MKTVKARNTGYYVIILFFLVLFQFIAFPSHATDVKELLREISSDLRQAERNMFGGKAEQAIASLETLKAKILQAKEADPNNPQVKTSENKFKKLVKDLERRTGKDLGGGSLTAAGAGTKTDLPPQPSAKPLSRPAEQAAAPAKPRRAVRGCSRWSGPAHVAQRHLRVCRPVGREGREVHWPAVGHIGPSHR